MTMPQNAYYALNRAFSAVREAEQEAAKLEAQAAQLRDEAQKHVQDAYDILNRASITLAKSDQ